ncbi:hypothetical protein SORBI_3002G426201 [Sorghum bicolor]|uniref:Uncharacterized protein n=1 Tax=Sorghum bicolor TaxID=4558 RepID=A0A1B6QGG9_SORBI|nr:hypothetical protein SORBI_3002G426201 [Sorghum bicolor]
MIRNRMGGRRRRRGNRTRKASTTSCLGRQLLHGHLLHLLVRPGFHLAAEAGAAEHGAVRVRVSQFGDSHPVDGDRLARDDDGVDDLPLRVVHGEHVKAAAPDLLGVDHRVEEAARPVRAPHHERSAGGHVPPEVLNDAGLVLGGHAHERREEDDVVRGELPVDVGHVGGAERHARLERGVAAHQATRPVVGVPADVVVVEGGGREVARRQDEGAERERAVLQLAEQDVVVEVGEERQVVQRVVERGEQVGVVRLHEALGVGAEADQAAAHLLQLRAQALHVDGAARDARRHQLGEESVHLRRRAQGRKLPDGGGKAGDLVHQRRLGLLVLLRRRHRRRLLLEDDLPLRLSLLLLLLAHADH